MTTKDFFSRLAVVEIQLIMQYIGSLELIKLSRCNRITRFSASQPFAWKYTPVLESKISAVSKFVRQLEYNKKTNNPTIPVQNAHIGITCLEGFKFSNRHIKDLVKILKCEKINIIKIHLDENEMSNKNILEIFRAIKVNKTLIDITVENNEADDECVNILTEAIKINKCIRNVNLYGNDITDKGMIQLSKTIQHSNLQSLNVSFNKMTDEGAIALFNAVKFNDTLTSLEVGICRMTSQGLRTLTDCIKYNKNITYLNIEGNEQHDDIIGILAIIDSLKYNDSITEMNMGLCGLDDECATALAETIKINKTIIDLDLEFNKIQDDGVLSLAEAMKHNKSIKKIRLNTNWTTLRIVDGLLVR